MESNPPASADPGRGAMAALVGGILGLMPATGLIALLFLRPGALEDMEVFAGKVALAALLAAPFGMVFVVSSMPEPGVRGGLLLPLGFASLAVGASLFLSYGLVFVPATLVIWFAAMRSLTAADRWRFTVVPAAAAGFVIAALVAFGFYALVFMQDPEPRCWAFRCTSDITTASESMISLGSLAVAFLCFVSFGRMRR